MMEGYLIVIKEALIEADTELSRLLELGLGPFAIAEAYSIPVRRLSTNHQLSLDETHQSLPKYLKGTPGILTWDYLRSALADQVMEIWNEKKERSASVFNEKGRDREVRCVQQRTSDEPRHLCGAGNRRSNMQQQCVLESVT